MLLDEQLPSKRYEPPKIDLDNKNHSHTLIIESAGYNKTVLEIGTSTGFISQILKERGNRVTGIEIDQEAAAIAQQFCDRMIIADIEQLDLEEIFKNASFNVIICGDVLEHLKKPETILKKLQKFLKPEGYIVVSLPNFFHGDVFLHLLKGDFHYTSLGLLDETHIRFFGLKNIFNIFTECGYEIRNIRSTNRDSGTTELQTDVTKIPKSLLKFIRSLPASTVYQYVFTAHPLDRVRNPILEEPDINALFSDALVEYRKEVQSPLEAKVIEQEEYLDKKTILMEELAQVVASENKQIAEMAEKISLLRQTLSNLNNNLAEANRQLQELSVKTQALEQEGVIKDQRIQGLSVKTQALEQEGVIKDQRIQELSVKTQALEQEGVIKDQRIQGLSAKTQALELKISSIENSIVWQLTMKFHSTVVERLLPQNSLRRKWYNRGLEGGRILIHEGYKVFFKKSRKYLSLGINRYPPEDDNAYSYGRIEQIIPELKALSCKPKISIIMPVYNVDKRWLEKAITSILSQVYENWELCIIDDASPSPHIREVIDGYKKKDVRIVTKYLTENKNISGALNEGLTLVSGEFVTFLDHDDELSPDALFEVVKLINNHQDAEIIYSDDDKIDENDRHYDFQFKPDWSPELLLSYCYISHIKVLKKTIIEKTGQFNSEFDGAQDYDYILRATEHTDKIYHIPQVLYHWRCIPGSTAFSAGEKPHSLERGRLAVQEALGRRGIHAEVIMPVFAVRSNIGVYKINYIFSSYPKVSIIIPSKDKVDFLKACISSIEQKTVYPNYEIIVADTGSEDRETLEYYDSIHHEIWSILITPFNFAKVINYTVRKCDNELILFLNNDTEVIDPFWLNEMVGSLLLDNNIGAVGGKLIYNDQRIQHAGVIIGLNNGLAGHANKLLHYTDGGYLNYSNVLRNYSAVTAACMLTRKSLFISVEGFNEQKFAIAYNDVDYCLKLREKGFRIVYNPNALLYHYEGASRGKGENMDNPQEELNFRNTWGTIITQGDPYYNPHLSLEDELFRIKKKSEMPTNILFISHNMDLEGAPISEFLLAAELKKRGNNVIVISPVDGPLAEKYRHCGIVVRIINGLFIENAKFFNQFINDHSFDIVYLNTILCYIFLRTLKKNNIPSIWVIRESEREHYFKSLPTLSQSHFKMPDFVVFVAEATRQVYSDLDSEAKFRLIYNGVNIDDIEHYKKTHDKIKIKQCYRFEKDDIIITNIGTICERKGQKNFIESAIEVLDFYQNTDTGRKIHFIIVGAGSGQYLAQIKSIIQNAHYGSQIHIFDETPEIYDYFFITDIFVCTSIIESFPRVILEAMAFELPILSTNVFGIPEQIEDGISGILIEPMDTNILTHNIISLMDHREEWRSLGNRAYQRVVTMFSTETMADNYEKLLNSLLD
jgi:glycosyltransferase involved in cell wall biosynthesis/cellulose synthase/poly-beta-1,6-N-acetylglucosamine synthase-like glycosyltransferase/2-polyprenyl-3-methyl-5-hydroxy-6-metoxy-1,4-benzoquinol methylase